MEEQSNKSVMEGVTAHLKPAKVEISQNCFGVEPLASAPAAEHKKL